jgi:hypothetical protein
MLLRLTDGTETVTLSGDGAAVLGCTYTPRPPAAGAKRVAEDAAVVIEGTAAEIVAATQMIERLLDLAGRATSDNNQLWVEFQRAGDTEVWRSRVYAGRLLWSDDPLRRRLHESQVWAVQVVAAWERDAWWETASEQDAGTTHVMNGQGVVPTVGYWIGPGGPTTYADAVSMGEGENARNAGMWADLAGVLPAPAHVTVTNESGGSITVQRVLLANDVQAAFSGAQHLLLSGAAASWTGSSAHSTARWALQLTDAQIAAAVKAGGVRLLAVMGAASSGVYLRAKLQQNTAGSVLVDAWIGGEVRTTANRKVYDLGVVAFPPDVATFSDFWLVISVYATATGSATLSFVQLCPGDLVVLEAPTALAVADGQSLEWHGERRYGSIKGYHATLVASGRLLLQPERPNRLMVLVESTSGVDSAAELAMNVRYRQRRATV